MVILHIIVALVSISLSGYAYLKPSRTKLLASYCLIAATFASGIVLAISNPAHMTETCLMGLSYLGLVGVSTMAARARLARNRL